MRNEPWIHTQGSYEFFYQLSFPEFDVNVFELILSIRYDRLIKEVKTHFLQP